MTSILQFTYHCRSHDTLLIKVLSLEQPVLLPFLHPPFDPEFHPLPALCTAYIDRWYDLVYSKSTAEHAQFSETAML